MIEQTPPRPPFKVSGVATIKHLNVRKQGPDDEKILAVDVKLEIKKVDRRLCAYFDDALEAFLWRGDTDALIARNHFLVPVQYGNEIKSASVNIGEDHYLGCHVKKFCLQAQDGGVMTLTCSVALYPSSSDVSELAKLVQDETQVTIEGPPDLFAGETGTSAHEAAVRMDDMLREDGATGTIKTSDGETLLILGDGPDPMYADAVAIIRTQKKASISLVQRYLKIGYNRAARLIEEMEKAGIVGPMQSNGQREIF